MRSSYSIIQNSTIRSTSGFHAIPDYPFLVGLRPPNRQKDMACDRASLSMAPSKRKRINTKRTKLQPVVTDSELPASQENHDVQDKLSQKDSEISDDQQPLLETGPISKKQKKLVSSDDDSDVPLKCTSRVEDISDHGEHETSERDEDPVAKVKKPKVFNLRSDSALADQTARSSKGKPGFIPQSSTLEKSSKLFFDSDLDNSNDSDNDSDGLHSAHSLEIRTPSKVLSKDQGAKETAPIYLDSFPEITDSGIKRNKDIQNNPMILDEDAIDPLLREDHKSLPALRQVMLLRPYYIIDIMIHRNTSVIQFVRYGQAQPEPASNVALGYENVIMNMASGPKGKQQLAAAVKFTYTLPFVNPSRASPALVTYDAGKICFKGENSKHGRNVVFITTGLIVDSQLKTPGDSTINPGHKIRQVLLLPFAGEVQRLLAYIGTVFETEEYVCLLESGTLILTTRREGAGGDYNNGNYATSYNFEASSSPVRPRVPAGLLTSSPVKLGTSPNPNKGKTTHFSPSLGFKDTVPIYDARGNQNFMFDQDSWKCINDLPIYNSGKTDIPPCKYIATVGYTVGSWKTRAAPDDDTMRNCASLNIQFVIILGKIDMKDLS
ncbi:hypothetical protein F5887DRAFT_919560 [Amanita rubescens]|nr:hypothetical protein F5887DRAFT_924783 [Amanita rubescens]KAF8340162.1 hypothetical protein F5887DRAFT_919560 [Amanita rubescens]